MNREDLKFILKIFDFQLQNETIQSIPGGPGGGNLIWKVNTSKGNLAIKQLDSTLEIKNEKIVNRYELCELVASKFAQHGIPAVHAINCSGRYLMIIENTAYLIYPWIEGYLLNNVSRPHAIKIAELVASIHKINLPCAEIQQKFDKYTNECIMDAVNQYASLKLPFAMDIKENKILILSLNDIYHAAIPVLSEISILTHGDVNQTNVIWNSENQPFLIDWEAIKKMNPTQEIIRTCLGWGIHSENISYRLFLDMITAYQKAGGPFNRNHIASALNSIFGNQIFWLMRNIKLACSTNSAEEKNSAGNQIIHVLINMKKLKDNNPKLISSIETFHCPV